MTAHTTLRAIFDDKLVAREKLEHAEETRLVRAAQDGDLDAYNTLLRQYAHGLRSLAEQEYARAGGHVSHDETRANVLLAFAEAVHECQAGDRVAFRLPKATLRVADEHHLVGGFTIAERTRQRYMQALREAGPDGDAEAKARELGMTRETFLSVRDALGASSFDGILEEQGDAGMQAIGLERGYSTVEQRADVAKAFAAVDVITGDVIRDAYGFTEYDPIPDAEIAHRRGYSRSKVQRLRSEGLSTMRKALNVPEVSA
ncbi:hypothetical protein MTE01_29230 [Microbacterium testaceum]|uniref:Uncharacterized protein n=1 Tax=Microbacterium testaceum TaxID=2033 RepID=A0A4Y3QRE4_MICTE|nr:hypothetical protein [Microbacterium testaceum]GEB46978.1 hypothetical protein MTE01_29230 [Microbacterium testaceum]